MSRKYWTLCERDPSTGLWSPQFGSTDRGDVVFERANYAHDVRKKDLRIITTGDTQAEIDLGVAKLNVDNQLRKA